MKYQDSVLANLSSDHQSAAPDGLSPAALSFAQSLPASVRAQLDLLDELSLTPESEELLDHLYRNNHIMAGMAKLHGLDKLAHLFQILDFALDWARYRKTVREHSIDYLIKLLYTKGSELAETLGSAATQDPDITDLVDESRNYLQNPLREWNLRIDEASKAYQSQPVHDLPVEEAVVEGPVAATTLPALEIPFDDEPEPLNVPLDKVGMISDFYEENSEILANFANLLIDLENATDTPALVDDLFRMIHTVKGGARLLNIKKLECLAHNMENLLDLVRKGKLKASSQVVDLLLDGKAVLSEMVEETASRGPFVTRIRPLVERLQALIAGQPAPAPAPTPAVSAPVLGPVAPPAPRAGGTDKDRGKNTESLRVSSEKLDEVLNTASEIFIGRIRFQNEITAIEGFLKSFKSTLERASELQRSRMLAKLNLYIPEFAKELKHLNEPGRSSGRSSGNRLGELLSQMVTRLIPDNSGAEMSLQEELNLNYLTIEEIQKQLQKNLETLEQLSTRLQNGAMSFRMVPISNLFERFPLQLRDLARTVGKKIRVDIVGGDTELDKVLINKLADPLLHMLRNSIDHGIEFPEERLALGKPEVGTITLETYYHGSYAVIEIRDDGRGINVDRVLTKALEKDLIPENKKGKLTDAEILELIFLPGFSTNDKVTELSGRGVGMDVVKTAINQLHGTIETESQAGHGSCFKLKLPLTLAIVKILLVQESSYQFALPILNIEALITVQRQEIRPVENRLIFNYQGQTIPVASLSAILNFPQSRFQLDKVQMVVLNENNRLTGILVDSVLGRQEILIKNLGRFLKKAPFVMGCTILRDSRLVLILDPRQIVEAVKQAGTMNLVAQAPTTLGGQTLHTVLIVDDSAIQRENLKTILKDTQYRVDTAENGFEALKACRSKTYSAFCVDILMPLMDGYEFVERLRKIPLYEQTPVVLITGKDVDQMRIASLKIDQVFKKPVQSEDLINLLDSRLLEKVEA
ncbi:MAG: response regulator [Spirochaetales bacterium]